MCAFQVQVSEQLVLCCRASAASIPLALDEMHRNGMLKSGQRVLLEGFGSGLSWGSYLFEW